MALLPACILLFQLFFFLAGAEDSSALPYPIDCDQPYVCLMDSLKHCTMSGRLVFGHCGLQAAICLDNEIYDPTGACLPDE